MIIATTQIGRLKQNLVSIILGSPRHYSDFLALEEIPVYLGCHINAFLSYQKINFSRSDTPQIHRLLYAHFHRVTLLYNFWLTCLFHSWKSRQYLSSCLESTQIIIEVPLVPTHDFVVDCELHLILFAVLYNGVPSSANHSDLLKDNHRISSVTRTGSQ